MHHPSLEETHGLKSIFRAQVQFLVLHRIVFVFTSLTNYIFCIGKICSFIDNEANCAGHIYFWVNNVNVTIVALRWCFTICYCICLQGSFSLSPQENWRKGHRVPQRRFLYLKKGIMIINTLFITVPCLSSSCVTSSDPAFSWSLGSLITSRSVYKCIQLFIHLLYYLLMSISFFLYVLCVEQAIPYHEKRLTCACLKFRRL